VSGSDDVYLKTVDRTLEVLLHFDEQRPEWSSSELAEVIGQHRSVVYRSLVTLERRGFVTRVDGGSRFRLGPKLVELGNVVLSGIDLRQIAYPVMKRLVRDTSESVFLTVVSGDESVCIDKIESSQKVRVTLDVGGRYPLHAGASNKLLLAYLPREIRNELMARGLPAHTADTLTEPDRLERDLAAIRDRGWASSIGELTPGVSAVAVPVKNSTGNVVAALSVAGLESRFADERFRELLAATQTAAEDISARLLNWKAPQSASMMADGRAGVRLGVIRVLTTRDEEMLHRHGRMLQQHIDAPGLEVISRCIGGHPEGVSTDADVLTATPRIVSLGRKMVRQDRVGALLVSCAADPGVGELRAAVAVPVVGAGSASASVAQALGRPVGALSITNEVLPAVADVLGAQLVAWGKPDSVRTTLDLQSKSDREALIAAGRRLIDAGAGVVLLACTGFSTLRIASALEEALAVPVIDPVLSAGMVTYYAARGNA
jgi:IclR family KDG regulon transcriptional repressor